MQRDNGKQRGHFIQRDHTGDGILGRQLYYFGECSSNLSEQTVV